MNTKSLSEMGITTENNDIVKIMGNSLYAKTPEALKRLLAELKGIGYDIKDCRELDKHDRDRGVTVEQKEKDGWSLWFASVRSDVRKGKCGSCNKHTPCQGIRAHGTKCPHCGAVLYREIVDGTTVRFMFTKQEYTMSAPQLQMKAKRWDFDAGLLYLCLDGAEIHTFGSRVESPEKVAAILAENDSQWEAVEEDGVKLIRVKYMKPWNSEKADINPHDIHGHEFNSTIVKVWNGKEYGEWDDLPVSESFNIYEAWHWSPWPSSPKLHAKVMSACGQVSDKGYYYQDGRPSFWPGVEDYFAAFIEHFTELDHEAFMELWPRMRKDGPGFIEDFARFCSDEPEIEDRPNMFNTITAICDSRNGKPLTKGQFEASQKGLQDPQWDKMGDLKEHLGI